MIPDTSKETIENMASQGQPDCRQCRREQQKLYLKGDRCYSRKCGFDKNANVPGMHGVGSTQKKLTDYGHQLREKQKLKRMYGMRENQFRLYVKEAVRRTGVTGENLLGILETRLDNVVYRCALASSRSQARQFVNHGHILVNGKKVDIPSCQLKPGDVVEVHENSKKIAPLVAAVNSAGGKGLPGWLQFNVNELKASVLRAPTRDEIDTDVQESLIVEFYSR